MARAKRTARAEARRRYRAQLAAGEAEPIGEDKAVDRATRAEAAPPPRTAERREPAPARPSLGHAFRTSFHQANFREDLAYLPTLVLRSKAVWLPSLLSIGSGVLLVSSPTDITLLIFQYFVYTPPVGALFIAGFVAPRASYLAGFIVAIVAAGVLAAVLPTGVLERFSPDSDFGAPDVQGAVIAQALTLGPFLGAVIAAASAWYKRFLRQLNPNRARQQRQATRGKQTRRR